MLNTFLGIGRLGRDAQVGMTRSDRPMARFTIAIERIQRKGQPSEPDWIPCHLFGERANALAPYLTKGTLVGVRGRLESYRMTGPEPREMLRVHVKEVNFLRRSIPVVTAAAPTPQAG